MINKCLLIFLVFVLSNDNHLNAQIQTQSDDFADREWHLTNKFSLTVDDSDIINAHGYWGYSEGDFFFLSAFERTSNGRVWCDGSYHFLINGKRFKYTSVYATRSLIGDDREITKKLPKLLRGMDLMIEQPNISIIGQNPGYFDICGTIVDKNLIELIKVVEVEKIQFRLGSIDVPNDYKMSEEGVQYLNLLLNEIE